MGHHIPILTCWVPLLKKATPHILHGIRAEACPGSRRNHLLVPAAHTVNADHKCRTYPRTSLKWFKTTNATCINKSSNYQPISATLGCLHAWGKLGIVVQFSGIDDSQSDFVQGVFPTGFCVDRGFEMTVAFFDWCTMQGWTKRFHTLDRQCMFQQWAFTVLSCTPSCTVVTCAYCVGENSSPTLTTDISRPFRSHRMDCMMIPCCFIAILCVPPCCLSTSTCSEWSFDRPVITLLKAKICWENWIPGLLKKSAENKTKYDQDRLDRCISQWKVYSQRLCCGRFLRKQTRIVKAVWLCLVENMQHAQTMQFRSINRRYHFMPRDSIFERIRGRVYACNSILPMSCLRTLLG